MDCKGLKESLAHISVVFLLRIASESCKDTNFCVLLKTCHIISSRKIEICHFCSISILSIYIAGVH